MYDHPVLKKYIRKVKYFLPCSGDEKKQLVAQMQESILDYLEQNPTADLNALQSHFGTPKQIANQYLYDQETSALLYRMSTKKKFLGLFAGVMAAVLLFWIGVISFDALDAHRTNQGYLKVVINQKIY